MKADRGFSVGCYTTPDDWRTSTASAWPKAYTAAAGVQVSLVEIAGPPASIHRSASTWGVAARQASIIKHVMEGNCRRDERSERQLPGVMSRRPFAEYGFHAFSRCALLAGTLSRLSGHETILHGGKVAAGFCHAIGSLLQCARGRWWNCSAHGSCMSAAVRQQRSAAPSSTSAILVDLDIPPQAAQKAHGAANSR